MKRFAVLIVLCALSLAVTVPGFAQPNNTASQNRAAQKAAKQQQKANKKYAKAQRKAEKKMLKTERKNTKLPPRHF